MESNVILTEQDLRTILGALESFTASDADMERLRRTRSKIAFQLEMIGKGKVSK